MPKELLLQVTPEIAANENLLKDYLSKQIKVSAKDVQHVSILKRSIDARQKAIKINLKVNIFLQGENFVEQKIVLPEYKEVSNSQEVIVVGAGPAGLFAALQLIELGLKPILIERGKDVRGRRRDLKAINVDHLVNEDSNYCFGEGGAGTYSDGKLYTRSKKRGDIDRILKLLVAFGATPDILVEAHPHIGTNKLPQIIQDIREKIIEMGGKVLFETRVTDILVKNNEVQGVVIQNGDTIVSNKIILATGHSARDIFELLDKKKIFIEAKPFALGVRAEHPQSLIDQIQYSCDYRGEHLPPAPYSIVKQVNGRGMYSFCMCPGGVIAPCATSPGEVVTNGWSPSKRDQVTANSGIVIELKLEDFKPFDKFGALAGMEFQKSIEQKAWHLAGETQKVPAQRMIDFTQNKVSKEIPKTSYVPGTTSVEMGQVFPGFLSQILREGFSEFGKSMKGYLTNEAILHAPESRTSSPVRIPRDEITLEHLQIKGLYPCGEGAGYAGGIISAAIDGEKCALKIGACLLG
ncbi:NAD(P)/FAD-dependent oxidoreductase [Flavobacterium psychrophilum]|uniref:NAD(P)/FAD-dependent oxidoreductase n=1 Tax=Flavobacterium psychrophilum TaxID=96345 RepID=UPI0004F6F22B|nr:FAD-binding protein [Flavobacterium psychrophilum]AIN73509.1 FAD-binding protein [Flavobacterium psychrophilum FPG3]EKT2071695.1 FAD-binding protein [Flavobacterium psychrophilum]EKT3956215.1 FAD-binding protein [Flavobacterium psychrophilum]EKT3965422.1 FAD-binding protein [Flavobacterium psychrophilum]EKT4491216.1 FAD-binding protein [Flavobacterium psychrophilum]